MLKSKISERVQEVILPDFPDDDNTVPTVTKSRRVSFGTNFVKEFIVGSAVSGQCMPEYEQAFPSSDSSTADSGADSGLLEHSMFAAQESNKIHKSVPAVSQVVEAEFVESRPKLPKFSSTVCFSADSPTADMEFTEGCLTLAKSILDKKNKEMTVIIQAKPKEPKDEEKGKEEDTKYFEGSQFEMSMTRCLKSKGNKREERRFESEKTKIFSKHENEMSITRCNRIFNEDDSDGSWEDCKENRMPLDIIMRHLDKDNSDLENDLFNPEKTFGNFFSGDQLDLTNESEKLNLNESMDISTDFQSKGARSFLQSAVSENQIRKSTQLNCHESGEEVLCPVVLEKSRVGELTDDRIDKSAEEMSLDEAQPIERGQSMVDAQSADCKVNSSIEQKDLQESEEVFTPETEQAVAVGDVINTSTQQSLDVCVEPSVPEKESSSVEPNKVSESIERNESEEVLTCEREPLLLDLPSTDKISESTDQRPAELPSIVAELEQSGRMSLEGSLQVLTPEKQLTSEEPPLVVDETRKSPERMSLDGSMEGLPSLQPTDTSTDNKLDSSGLRASFEGSEEIQSGEAELPLTDLPTTDRISESVEVGSVELSLSHKSKERKSFDGHAEKLVTETEPSLPDPMLSEEPSTGRQSLYKAESFPSFEREPSLVDVKVIESLKEQSKEPGCVWSLKDLRHPQPKTQGLLLFKCNLLESSTAINFDLKMSNEDSLVACSVVTNSEISLDEEKQSKLPEYRLVVDFGFDKLKKYFHECRIKVETLRQVPYFLDQVNSFMMKMNAYLRQIYSILTMYPGSRLDGSQLSFRLYSFPVFFSCMLSIDLSNLFRLSKSSLSFEIDFGNLDENKIREIFQDCLKCENPLCEFVMQSTKCIIDLEKELGCVSKRGHIRLLPAELKL